MPFFDLIIRWVELSDFGPKSDDLGQRIHKSDVIPSDFGKLDCVSRPTFFSVRKIKIRSLESDRIINGLLRYPKLPTKVTGNTKKIAHLLLLLLLPHKRTADPLIEVVFTYNGCAI